MGRQLTRIHQRGETLIFTLLILMVVMLSFMYLMRGVMSDTLMTGNNLARQKDVHVADIAMRNVEQSIFLAYGGSPLEYSALSSAWYRDVPNGTASPDASYWASCSGNASAALRCAPVTLNFGAAVLPGYTALAVVQPTGRTDPYTCNLTQFLAVYYDVYIHTTESSGATAATTHTVYKLCVNS